TGREPRSETLLGPRARRGSPTTTVRCAMRISEDPGPGQRLGRYELLRLIGEGGMAQVWAARMEGSRGFHKVVALKTLIPALARDPQFQHMFLDEANLASKIH